LDYVFYFDESFHDRKIKINSKARFNILTDNSLDNYIGVFWGCHQNSLQRNIALLTSFENQQKRNYGLCEDQELKSTTISKKNFKHGIYSFNRKTLNFYHSLFSLIRNINPIIQINAISKMEYFIRRAFVGIRFPTIFDVNINTFFYSLTKFFITYRHEKLVMSLYNAQDLFAVEAFQEELLNTLEEVIYSTRNIPRKEREHSAFLQLWHILTAAVLDVNVNSEVDFRYYPNFDGLCKLLIEVDINPNRIKLVIDNEDNTFIEAQRYSFGKVKQADSKNVIQLRLSDFLSGFIGRMMYAISTDPLMLEDEVTDIRKLKENDLSSKRLLSPEWFDIDEKKFELYCLIYKALFEEHQHYWTIMTMSYADQMASFCSLIKHFAGFDDFKSYKSVSAIMHSEYFNSRCCDALLDHYHS